MKRRGGIQQNNYLCGMQFLWQIMSKKNVGGVNFIP